LKPAELQSRPQCLFTRSMIGLALLPMVLSVKTASWSVNAPGLSIRHGVYRVKRKSPGKMNVGYVVNLARNFTPASKTHTEYSVKPKYNALTGNGAIIYVGHRAAALSCARNAMIKCGNASWC